MLDLANGTREISAASLASNPKASVVMLAYNHGHYIDAAIESVVAQACAFDFEVIVGEDCSTDDTRRKAETWVERAPRNVRLRCSDQNVGMNENFRDVIQAARAPYMAFLECDDVWIDEQKLSKQVSLLEDADCSLVYADYARAIEVDGIWRWIHGVNRQSGRAPAEGDAFASLLCAIEVHLSTMCCRTADAKAYMASDLFDPTLRLGDVPLILYLALQGRVRYITDVVSVYRSVPNSATNRSLESRRRVVFDHARTAERFLKRFPDRAPGLSELGAHLDELRANAAFSARDLSGFCAHSPRGIKTSLKSMLMRVPALHHLYVQLIATRQQEHFAAVSAIAEPLNPRPAEQTP